MIEPKTLVAYIGGHPDATPEFGLVSSANHKYVFVKFLPRVIRLGFDGATSQGCNPDDLYCADWTGGTPDDIGHYFVKLATGEIGQRYFGPGPSHDASAWWNDQNWNRDFKCEFGVISFARAYPKQHFINSIRTLPAQEVANAD